MSMSRADWSFPSRRRICRCARRWHRACATHACRRIGRLSARSVWRERFARYRRRKGRLAECARLGFTAAVTPRENTKHLRAPEGMRVYGVETLAEALAILFG